MVIFGKNLLRTATFLHFTEHQIRAVIKYFKSDVIQRLIRINYN